MEIKVTLTIEAGRSFNALFDALAGREVVRQSELKFDEAASRVVKELIEVYPDTAPDEANDEVKKPVRKSRAKAAKTEEPDEVDTVDEADEGDEPERPAPTATEIRALASGLAKKGKLKEVRELIRENGGQHLNDVPEENYVPFYESLKLLR